MTFDINNIPSQKGKIAIVTGANVGLGFETVLAFAKKEMKVIMACRNQSKAEKAKQEILQQVPDAELEIRQIDLSKLSSVRLFAEQFLADYQQLDLLINNAGVMMCPYQETEDGFELQMAANYFGHFLLTGLLLETIEKTPKSRIVSLSSSAHQSGKINFDDLQSKQKYSKFGAYAQSKLACLMYAYELQRRLDKAGYQTLSVAAHPGASETDLGRHFSKFVQTFVRYTVLRFITHSPKSAVRPTLLAALGTEVSGGEYFGPQGFMEMKGAPGKAKSTRLSRNPEVTKQLWEVSEKLTGLAYP